MLPCGSKCDGRAWSSVSGLEYICNRMGRGSRSGPEVIERSEGPWRESVLSVGTSHWDQWLKELGLRLVLSSSARPFSHPSPECSCCLPWGGSIGLLSLQTGIPFWIEVCGYREEEA